MEHKQTCPLLFSWGAQWLRQQWKQSALPFLSSLMFGVLAYLFAFTNKLLNHDEAHSLFIKGATVDSGRWGLGALDSIFPNISMPWIYGIITIVLISAAICILVRIFRVENRVLQVLLSGCVMVFPSLIGTFGYMFTSSSFALSFLMSVIAVWFLQWNLKWGFLPALGCMVFSLSIYQSYIAVAAGLLVLVLIRQLLHGQEIGTILRSGVVYIFFLALSLGLYYGATQEILKLLDVQFNSYASGNMGFSLASIPANIAASYQSFFRYINEGFQGIIPTVLSRRMHQILLLASGALLLLWGLARDKKEPARFLLLAALIGILPLAVNCMYLFTVPDSIHTLVLYGFIGIYVLTVILADVCIPLLSRQRWQSRLRCALVNVVTVCLAVVIVINVYVANAAYLNLHLRYENAYSFYTALAADIKMMPAFDEDTSIAIVGTYQEPGFYEEKFPFLLQLTGVKGFLPDSYSRARFLEYYIGLPIPCASDEEMEAIKATDAYAQMPSYPYYGSMEFFGDVLVVKLS